MPIFWAVEEVKLPCDATLSCVSCGQHRFSSLYKNASFEVSKATFRDHNFRLDAENCSGFQAERESVQAGTGITGTCVDSPRFTRY